MKVVAVDVGLSNFAFVWVDVGDRGVVTVSGVRRLDLTLLCHERVTRAQCTLQHGNNATDRIEHFLQEHGGILDDADVILIEQQPPGGLVHVEQLLFSRYRNKAQLCSPVSLHKWLGIGGLDYEARKERTVARAAPYLNRFSHYWRELRKHDMADAMCMILFWVDSNSDRFIVREPIDAANLNEWFSRFVHNKASS